MSSEDVLKGTHRRIQRVVFLSARADELSVGPIAYVIESVCRKDEQVSDFEYPGAPWAPVVVDSIDEADVVLIFSSRNSQACETVSDGWKRAIELDKKIVIVLLDSSYAPDELSGYHCVNLRHLTEDCQIESVNMPDSVEFPTSPKRVLDSVCALTAASEIFSRIKQQSDSEENVKQPCADLSWDDVNPTDVIGLEIGYRLIPLVDKTRNESLLRRIRRVRRRLSKKAGIIVPSVRIRDNLDLSPHDYHICLNGVREAAGEVFPDRLLAVYFGCGAGCLDGPHSKDPVYQRDSVWIDTQEKQRAEALGYTVIEPAELIASHLHQVLWRKLRILLGYEETHQLLDSLRESHPRLVNALTPEALSFTQVRSVLCQLLEEQVPIQNIKTIVETLVTYAPRTQDPLILVSAVRAVLSRERIRGLVGVTKEISTIVLDAHLEQMLRSYVKSGKGVHPVIDVDVAKRLKRALSTIAYQTKAKGLVCLLFVQLDLRYWIVRFVKSVIPEISVFSYEEIPPGYSVKVIDRVRLSKCD